MAKKILALVCILAVLTGISAATVLKADASATNYQVGFPGWILTRISITM